MEEGTRDRLQGLQGLQGRWSGDSWRSLLQMASRGPGVWGSGVQGSGAPAALVLLVGGRPPSDSLESLADQTTVVKSGLVPGTTVNTTITSLTLTSSFSL